MSNPHPNIQVTGDKAAELAKKIDQAADEEVASYKPVQQPRALELDSPTIGHSLVLDNKQANFDQKIYMMPESYNALRRELMENWPNLWEMAGYYMAFQAEDFIAIMNGATGLKLQFDTQAVDWTCQQYLTKLRQMRGLSF